MALWHGRITSWHTCMPFKYIALWHGHITSWLTCMLSKYIALWHGHITSWLACMLSVYISSWLKHNALWHAYAPLVQTPAFGGAFGAPTGAGFGGFGQASAPAFGAAAAPAFGMLLKVFSRHTCICARNSRGISLYTCVLGNLAPITRDIWRQ